MPTNDERRKVAESLRSVNVRTSLEGAELAAKWYETICAAIGGKRDPWMGIKPLCDRLADLIEPAPERTCRNKVVKDNKEFPPEYRTDNFICSACGAHFFADSEYINHPIDWAFCPDCGAKVVDE